MLKSQQKLLLKMPQKYFSWDWSVLRSCLWTFVVASH